MLLNKEELQICINLYFIYLLENSQTLKNRTNQHLANYPIKKNFLPVIIKCTGKASSYLSDGKMDQGSHVDASA